MQNVRSPDVAAMTYRMLFALRTTRGVLHQLVTGDSHVWLLYQILLFDPFFIPKTIEGTLLGCLQSPHIPISNFV